MKNIPTAFQRNALWTAVTAFSITLIGALAIGFIYLATRTISFLQPILIPFAVAAVLAYLLEPGVAWLERRGIKRPPAVLLVFAIFSLALGGFGWWLGLKLGEQTVDLDKKVLRYTQRARTAVIDFAGKLEKEYGITLPHGQNVPNPSGTPANSTTPPANTSSPAAPTPPTTEPVPASPATPSTTATPAAPVEDEETAPANPNVIAAPPQGESDPIYDLQKLLSGDWIRTALPAILRNAWTFVKSSVGGFLGIFGFLLSMIIVPLYLYYFLIESAKIKQSWSDYLPLRASAFKDEVVSCLTEINRYLVAFFRGQLFVSVINGIATGVGLMIIGLDFGLVIGVALCAAGIIPYLGIALCWIPAVIIAAVQGGSALIPAEPWWIMPVAVSAIFIVVQQIDALFITPRVVGEAVGLHPMTVIASVFLWTLLLGGLLGAILAVPLTASIKVLFQRYVWRARLAPRTVGGQRGQTPA